MAPASQASGRGPYRVEFRWKEEVIYWEGDRGFVFDGGWGVSPPVTYVPTPELWDEVVPSWMKGRRDEVVARLRAHPGHVLAETSRYQGGWQELGPGQ
ncbi:MAG: hypothetical protein ABSA91_03300 [Acidimicrobiales bacterium]|jgi:hypothetical protein